MATLTIRKLDENIKTSLRVRAATHGLSMEEEARQILRRALSQKEEPPGLGTRIHDIFARAGGVDEDIIPPRSLPRSPVSFADEDKG